MNKDHLILKNEIIIFSLNQRFGIIIMIALSKCIYWFELCLDELVSFLNDFVCLCVFILDNVSILNHQHLD